MTQACAQRLMALREAGMHSRDPVGWHYLQTLSSRTAAQTGAAQALLEEKLCMAIDAFEAGVQQPLPAPRPQPPGASALAQLVQDMQGDRTLRSAPAAQHGSAASASRLPAESTKIRQFRRQLHSIGVQKQVRQAVAQAPQNAGPINSHMLTLRALVLLRDLSPHYLERLMTQVDTLLRLEDAQKLRAQPSRNRASVKNKR